MIFLIVIFLFLFFISIFEESHPTLGDSMSCQMR